MNSVTVCRARPLIIVCVASPSVDSRTSLEREYLFVDVITTFLRAIRVGTIAVQHGAVLLSHYGRLGASFDACAKVIVDMIKEEGLSKGNGELVVNVATKSLQEVSPMSIKRKKANAALGIHADSRRRCQ